MLEDAKLKQMPFTVPDGYFDTLPLRIEELKLKRSKRSSFPVRKVLAFAGSGMAAAVALLFSISSFYGGNVENSYANDFRRSTIKIKNPHSESINRINNIFKATSFNRNVNNKLYKEDLEEALIDYMASETYTLDNTVLYADF